jgi:hypothetical protein
MFASRIYRISRTTWKVFLLVMVFVSYTFCVREALASPVVSAEHVTPEGSYVIRENTFHLNKSDPSSVEHIEFTILGLHEVHELRVRFRQAGILYTCEVVHFLDQSRANCDTSLGMQLRVEDMETIQIVSVY